MIVRAILQQPELALDFDYFNDYKDTYGWLSYFLTQGTPAQQTKAKLARHLLEKGYEKFCDRFYASRMLR